MREARNGVRQAGEAGRQLREVPWGPRMAGVTMVAPAPSGAPPVARAGVRIVVGAVAVEVVAAGPGLFLRIVLGLIARPDELRRAVDRCGPPIRSRR
ncbi:hypothetical protein [Streptomyces decoyicus]